MPATKKVRRSRKARTRISDTLIGLRSVIGALTPEGYGAEFRAHIARDVYKTAVAIVATCWYLMTAINGGAR